MLHKWIGEQKINENGKIGALNAKIPKTLPLSSCSTLQRLPESPQFNFLLVFPFHCTFCTFSAPFVVRQQPKPKQIKRAKCNFFCPPAPPHRNGKSFFLQNSTKNRLVGSRFTIFLLLRFLESDRTCIEGGWGAKQQNCVIFHRNARLDEREKCRAKVPPPPYAIVPFPAQFTFRGQGKNRTKGKFRRKSGRKLCKNDFAVNFVGLCADFWISGSALGSGIFNTPQTAGKLFFRCFEQLWIKKNFFWKN